MSIKQAILDKAKNETIEFSEYANLILDDQPIGAAISQDDSQFLEQFTECKLLSLNNCQLKDVGSLPHLVKLEQLEIEDN